jgi:hypothetical protein
MQAHMEKADGSMSDFLSQLQPAEVRMLWKLILESQVFLDGFSSYQVSSTKKRKASMALPQHLREMLVCSTMPWLVPLFNSTQFNFLTQREGSPYSRFNFSSILGELRWAESDMLHALADMEYTHNQASEALLKKRTCKARKTTTRRAIISCGAYS